MARDSSTNRIQETNQECLKQGNIEKNQKDYPTVVLPKGKKEGSINSNFIVGISFSKGVVLCKQYFGPIIATKFANIVDSSFHSTFENSINPVPKRDLIDGCPRQNSRTAHNDVARIGGLAFKIPPRSPNLNAIKNFFNLVVHKLNNRAIEKALQTKLFRAFQNV